MFAGVSYFQGDWLCLMMPNDTGTFHCQDVGLGLCVLMQTFSCLTCRLVLIYGCWYGPFSGCWVMALCIDADVFVFSM